MLNLLSLLITPVYTLLLFNRVCFGELKLQFQNLLEQAYFFNNKVNNNLVYNRFSLFDLSYLEFFIMFILLFLIFFMGIYPQYILSLLIHSASLYTIALYFLI